MLKSFYLTKTSGAQVAIVESVSMLKKCGKLCAIGLGAKENVQIPWNEAIQKSLDIVSCMSSGYISWEKALSLMAHTDKNLKILITHKASLENREKVFNELESERGIKAMFLPEQ